jgi:hypothetical protein
LALSAFLIYGSCFFPTSFSYQAFKTVLSELYGKVSSAIGVDDGADVDSMAPVPPGQVCHEEE